MSRSTIDYDEFCDQCGEEVDECRCADLASCRSCLYWASLPPSYEAGQCRRHAPQGANEEKHFPITHHSVWCGDYEDKTDTEEGS